jgi:DNA-binding beta-propeller fold protein YncE
VSASPVQLYLDLDETTVLSADQGTADKPGHTVLLIDAAAAMTVCGAVGTGSGPHGVVIDTAGTRAWVTNNYDNTVSVINPGRLSVVGGSRRRRRAVRWKATQRPFPFCCVIDSV